VILRQEVHDDQEAIRAVHRSAFARPDGEEPAETKLVDALREDGYAIQALSLVALADDTVVGHVTCSRGRVDGRPLAGLGPLGVMVPHQHRGVGSALMHAVLAAADALGEPAVVLLGDPGYYSRFGFVLAQPLGLLPPDPDWAPHFQVRLLHAWDGPLGGMYHYAPAFDRL
jgi:putative acetyltransferase